MLTDDAKCFDCCERGADCRCPKEMGPSWSLTRAKFTAALVKENKKLQAQLAAERSAHQRVFGIGRTYAPPAPVYEDKNIKKSRVNRVLKQTAGESDAAEEN